MTYFTQIKFNWYNAQFVHIHSMKNYKTGYCSRWGHQLRLRPILRSIITQHESRQRKTQSENAATSQICTNYKKMKVQLYFCYLRKLIFKKSIQVRLYGFYWVLGYWQNVKEWADSGRSFHPERNDRRGRP